MFKELPISSRFRESPMSFTPEKEMVPFMRTLETASVVWACQVRISS